MTEMGSCVVGTNVGDIGIWEVGSRDRLAQRTFKVWDITAASMPMQVSAIFCSGCECYPDCHSNVALDFCVVSVEQIFLNTYVYCLLLQLFLLLRLFVLGIGLI